MTWSSATERAFKDSVTPPDGTCSGGAGDRRRFGRPAPCEPLLYQISELPDHACCSTVEGSVLQVVCVEERLVRVDRVPNRVVGSPGSGASPMADGLGARPCGLLPRQWVRARRRRVAGSGT